METTFIRDKRKHIDYLVNLYKRFLKEEPTTFWELVDESADDFCEDVGADDDDFFPNVKTFREWIETGKGKRLVSKKKYPCVAVLICFDSDDRCGTTRARILSFEKPRGMDAFLRDHYDQGVHEGASNPYC